MDLQSPRPATSVRRNPPRRAKQASATPVLSFSKFSKVGTGAGVNPLSLNELLEDEPSLIGPISGQNLLKSSGNLSNNLKVFLRIRPLESSGTKGSKNAGDEARAPGRAKVVEGVERKSRPCLLVNSSTSVTLNAPLSAPDSKRAKSEIYDGFSHVFPPESLQEDIYKKLMQPLVKDFMEGHSSLLVAMGPTSSGKTHTMFGSPQQLGIIPLALSQIFSQKAENENIRSSRTYYLSMFEIHSERGKGEKIFDLSPESTDTKHPQTSISSVKEVKITTIVDAENIVSHGISKRSTAPTNANNQSSRSQCIVNVRCVMKNGVDDYSISTAVLTIADLAGAERERKTGNQGARLLESNFINNTSMVFGLCLRSLLEHQKNPRKPIEKHFKNSLLTRYLQDYMEGKKQMTLILTVKAAEEDYMDTSFILRQASPYMKIKYNHLQENKNAPCQKRNAAVIDAGRNKRIKANFSEASLKDGNHVVVDAALTSQLSERDSAREEFISKHINVEAHVELQKIKRSEEVMRNFASAFWSMLKQYKNKLKLTENQVCYLEDSLREKSAQATDLEKELAELRSSCSCLQKLSVEEYAKAPFNHLISVPSIPADLCHLHDTDALPDDYHTLSAKTFGEAGMDQDAAAIDRSDIEDIFLPIHRDTLQQDQLEIKVAVPKNDKESTISDTTESLTSEKDDPALRPLNFKRPKRKLLPASEVLLKDLNELVMDENAKEFKRKEAASVRDRSERSEGSISLIRILKSNLPR